MSIPTPPELARGRVTWTVGRTDGTTLPGARGTVRFEATAVAVAYSTATVLPAPVETPVVAGVMTPVDLLVNDPEVWNWKVTPRLGVVWESFHIDVDGPVDLATAAVVPGKGPIRAVKGVKGDPGTATTISQVDGLQSALDGKARKEPINLGSENLNTILDDGTYSQSSSATATAALNYPVNSNGLYTAGTLKVTSRVGDSLVVQEYVSYNGKDSFWRAYYLGTWYPWERSTKASEFDPLSARVTALEQDTGPRILNSLITGYVSGDVILQRIGKLVLLSINELVVAPNNGATTWSDGTIIPTGFRFFPPAYKYFSSFARTLNHNRGEIRVNRYGGLDIYNVYDTVGAKSLATNVSAFWPSNQVFPSTPYPGTPG